MRKGWRSLKKLNEDIIVVGEPKPEMKLIDKTPKQYIKCYKVNIVNTYDLERQLIATKKIIRETLLRDLAIHKGLKVNTLVNLILVRPTKFLSELIPGDHYVSTEAVIITTEEDVNKFVESRRILKKIDTYNYQSSSVRVEGIKEHITNI